MKLGHLSVVACLVVVQLSISVNAAISINGYAAATNDRFSNSGSFIMSGFDLSGVGQNTIGRWATAISRNVVISAAHFPPNSAAISFYAGNDPTATPVTRNIVSGMQIAGTDLYLGVLDANLPSSIVHYSYAQEPMAGTLPTVAVPFPVGNAGIYQGMNAYMFGLSPEAHPSFQDQAVGRNAVFGYSENVDFQGNADNDSMLFATDSPADSAFVAFEAQLASGDSGGPTFVDIGGELRLLGTNAFSFTGPTGSGINYTGNQATAINSFILANAVPEPTSGLVLGLAMGGIFGSRRRRLAAPTAHQRT